MKLYKKVVSLLSFVSFVSVMAGVASYADARDIAQGSAGMWNAVVKYRTSATNANGDPLVYANAEIHAASQFSCQVQVAWYLLFSGSTVTMPCTYGAIGSTSTSSPK